TAPTIFQAASDPRYGPLHYRAVEDLHRAGQDLRQRGAIEGAEWPQRPSLPSPSPLPPPPARPERSCSSSHRWASGQTAEWRSEAWRPSWRAVAGPDGRKNADRKTTARFLIRAHLLIPAEPMLIGGR